MAFAALNLRFDDHGIGVAIVIAERTEILLGAVPVGMGTAHEAEHTVGELVLELYELTVLLHAGTESTGVLPSRNTFHFYFNIIADRFSFYELCWLGPLRA
jgi:hypothetical protein